MGTEVRVDAGDARDRVAQPRGDGLAGAFGLVAEPPGDAAEPGRSGQLGDEGVASRGAARTRPRRR